MCRELQPIKKKYFSAIKRRYSMTYSKDDEMVSYSSSYSDTPEQQKRQSLDQTRKRNVSESETVNLISSRKEFNKSTARRIASDSELTHKRSASFKRHFSIKSKKKETEKDREDSGFRKSRIECLDHSQGKATSISEPSTMRFVSEIEETKKIAFHEGMYSI